MAVILSGIAEEQAVCCRPSRALHDKITSRAGMLLLGATFVQIIVDEMKSWMRK
jgi:hypothetical protein